MARESLDRNIHHLQDEILLLGNMVEQGTMDTLEALKLRDFNLAHRIIKDDQMVNDKRYAIENAILILIATQQPVAHDLRMLASMLEVIIELERMGDYAKGIAQVTLRIGDANILVPNCEFGEMGNRAVSMLHRALDAFVKDDARIASIIFLEDDYVDDLYKRVESMVIQDIILNPQSCDVSTSLIWVAHNLERMADRVTNICERTIFINTGEQIELDVVEDDDPE
jgi:phosphate transport system protein